MVAALFEGDLRYAVTVFGKPTSLDGLLTPANYALPDTLRRCVDVDFTFYEGVELFRAFRFEGDANNLTLFSIQTHAYSISSGRAGPFIGAGIFARAAVNPVALVKALRELMHNAQSVLMRDGRFIVAEIGTNEKRLVSIPDSVDAVPDPNGHWFDKPIQTNHAKHMLILPNAAGVKTPAEFFSNVMFDPYAYSRNAFFCTNFRVADDCRQRSNEFEVLTVDKLLRQHRLAFEGLLQKNAAFTKALANKEQQHAQQLAIKAQEHEHATLEIRNSVKRLHAENSTLNSENEKMRRKLDRLIPPPKSKHGVNRFDKVTRVFIALAVIICVVLLGFSGYKLYTFLSTKPTTEKPTSIEQRPPLSLPNEAGNNSTGQIEVGVATRSEAGSVKPKVNITK